MNPGEKQMGHFPYHYYRQYQRQNPTLQAAPFDGDVPWFLELLI